ncbi:hypothetical protein SLI_7532 [Streptomyces lividans 1326]|uniref:Uncharacterized protein n=1 Tax=Streptomyces lividans 1326 TaxID=1200984 RepID=A0A7U9E1E5_STRLI|nr:hypothetical protein SLI_7532 [Streptomyces lividans 1326]
MGRTEDRRFAPTGRGQPKVTGPRARAAPDRAVRPTDQGAEPTDA